MLLLPLLCQSSCSRIAFSRRCIQVPLARARARASSRRSFSARDVESHTVTCGSSGSISVDLYNRSSSPASAPYIIYLPPHPTYPAASPFPSFLNSHPVARINYRWNHQPSSSAHLTSSPLYRNHAFPTPLHDVLHAYTWLSSHLSSPEFYVYGSQLGGTLATSLALTESRATRIKNTPKIRGLIARDAVFDWTGVATTRDPLQSPDGQQEEDGEVPSHHGLWTTQTLHHLKTTLFAEPAQCFDAFASPILFFRTAGTSIPATFPGMRPAFSAVRTEVSLHDLFLDDEGNVVEAKNPVTETAASLQEAAAIEVTPKAHLTFPPRKSGLRIPRSLIMTTLASTSSSSDAGEARAVLEDQAEEMCRLLRRSILVHESKDRGAWEDSFDAHAEADTRIRYRTLAEEGECEGESEGDEESRLVREWLEDDM